MKRFAAPIFGLLILLPSGAHADDSILTESARAFATQSLKPSAVKSHGYCFGQALTSSSDNHWTKSVVVRSAEKATHIRFEHDGSPADGCRCTVTVSLDGSGSPNHVESKIVECVGG